jgi:hypothetical protein
VVYERLLKVVAIRFDACFREAGSPCQKQIRFVWQPVEVKNGKATTYDGAVHSFHAFDDQTFAAILEELKALRLGENPTTLTVHPALAREGYGPRWEQLKRILTKYCQSRNFVRATMTTSNPRGTIWTFTGFDVKNGQLHRIQIPRVGTELQGFFTASRNAKGEFRAGMNPEPPGEEAFVSLLKNSEDAKTQMTDRSLISATKSALKAENPRLSDPGTLDCASCHTAHVIPLWSMKNFSWDWENSFASELFARLDPLATQEPVNVLRAFGYFEDRPVISRRMHNEAAETTALFNEEYP